MDNRRNRKNIVLWIAFILIILSLCVLFATGVINFNLSTLNSNIIVTKNGKVISNEIPDDLVGKYVNENSQESYIQLMNDNIVVSEPTGGGVTRIFKNNQVKLYINFLNINEDSEQYITVEFYVGNNEYNQKEIYTYVGEKSLNDNKYHFKTIDSTPVGGEGNGNYPYSKQ